MPQVQLAAAEKARMLLQKRRAVIFPEETQRLLQHKPDPEPGILERPEEYDPYR
jgi:hypothetical protein